MSCLAAAFHMLTEKQHTSTASWEGNTLKLTQISNSRSSAPSVAFSTHHDSLVWAQLPSVQDSESLLIRCYEYLKQPELIMMHPDHTMLQLQQP